MARVNLVLSDTQEALIDDLRELCDLQTRKDVVENALMILGWAATESAKGLSIASVDDARKVYREVQTPALHGARLKALALQKKEQEAQQKDVSSDTIQQKGAFATKVG